MAGTSTATCRQIDMIKLITYVPNYIQKQLLLLHLQEHNNLFESYPAIKQSS